MPFTLYYDCTDQHLGSTTCRTLAEHKEETAQYYQVKIGKIKRVVKLCDAQATMQKYGWKIIKQFDLPDHLDHLCRCGASEEDLTDDLCDNELCEECCRAECDVCVACSEHGTKQHPICHNGRCHKCCVDHCKECAYCHLHTDTLCVDDRCNKCCNARCQKCGECGEHAERLCEYCHQCTNNRSGANTCCDCVVCPDCDGALEDCGECGRCANCCECSIEEGENTVPSDSNYGHPYKAKDKEHRTQFDCSRLVGVEWEYNSAATAKLNDWKNKWGGQLIHDGSCGYEAVTPPVSGDYMVDCLSELGKAFKSDNAAIDDRCGVHVHVDAYDLAWNDMFRMLKVYSLTEPVLYMLAGQNRIQNRYCIPCGDRFAAALTKPDKKGAVLEAAYTERGGRTGHQYIRHGVSKKDGNRYKGLNLCPWLAGRKVKAKDTTVEFRIHKFAPFAETDRVINWAKVCARIVEWSHKASDKDVDDLPKSGLRALCKVVAPECGDWILERLQSWKKGTSRKEGIPRRIRLQNGKYVLDLSK